MQTSDFSLLAQVPDGERGERKKSRYLWSFSSAAAPAVLWGLPGMGAWGGRGGVEEKGRQEGW